MRQVLKEEWLEVPSDGKRRLFLTPIRAVTVSIKSRHVTVKGPRGSITKDLSHAFVEIR